MNRKKARKVIKSDDLITMSQAKERFGRGWSRTTIYERIANGELIEGKHWIDDSKKNSSRKSIKLVVSAIEKYRSTPIALR